VQARVRLCRLGRGEAATAAIPINEKEEPVMISSRILAVSAAAVLLSSPAAFAQDSSYTPGTVWTFNYIQTEPGQYEKYLDYLAGNWRKVNELQKKEGVLVSYHIFAVNNPRNGEPDLILAFEFKDYVPTAQQLEIQKKVEALLASDAHKQDTASGERKSMRKLMGSMEVQELKLK
jgi:hypothetical protein